MGKRRDVFALLFTLTAPTSRAFAQENELAETSSTNTLDCAKAKEECSLTESSKVLALQKEVEALNLPIAEQEEAGNEEVMPWTREGDTRFD